MYGSMRWFQQFVQSSHPTMVDLRRRLSVTFVPSANPASYGRNTPNPRLNANAVDLNRNWNYNWAAYTPVGADDYKGTSAASEPETQAIAALLRSSSIVIDSHNFGPTPADQLLFNCPPVGSVSSQALDTAILRWANIYATPQTMTAWIAGSSTAPWMINWATSVTKLPAMLLEAPSTMFDSVADIGSRYYASRPAIRVYAGAITEFVLAATPDR